MAGGHAAFFLAADKYRVLPFATGKRHQYREVEVKSTLVKDKGGTGSWILILGCPLKEKYSLSNSLKNVSGPTFADCAHCEYQVGINAHEYGSFSPPEMKISNAFSW